MTIAGVGTAREAVTGGKLMVVGAGSDRLEAELEGIDNNVEGYDGRVEGVTVDGVAEV